MVAYSEYDGVAHSHVAGHCGLVPHGVQGGVLVAGAIEAHCLWGRATMKLREYTSDHIFIFWCKSFNGQ